MKVLFTANIPSPYRVDFFNELGKKCDLTVTFEGRSATNRDENWKNNNYSTFDPVFLKGKRISEEQFFCPNIVKILKEEWDYIILGGYSSPTAMLAIEYMRLHKIPFWLEADGGIIHQDSKLKYWLKKHFISSASAWLSSGENTTDYLVHYGADKERIYRYPFTSLKKADFVQAYKIQREAKEFYRKRLNMREDHIILSAGRFSHDAEYDKGYDVLLNISKRLTDNTRIYIIGDEPTEEFIKWKQEKELEHVHFIGFKTKDELAEFYAAVDLFVLFSRGDVWEPVINEAMMFGLPVITSELCVAGIELVQNEENGYIVDIENLDDIVSKINTLLLDSEKLRRFSDKAIKKIQTYSIENMAEKYAKFMWGEVRGKLKKYARNRISLKEKKMILFVGQPIHRKGLDVLLKLSRQFDQDTALYMVGGILPESVSHYIRDNGLKHVYSVGFLNKWDLYYYYQAADIFVLPTREDIWGLVVNEALMCGVRVITTNRCVAGLELVNKNNGTIIPVEDEKELMIAIDNLLQRDPESSAYNCVKSVWAYTVENMANAHLRIMRQEGEQG